MQEVSRKMQDAQVRRMLIVESGRLLGVISTADLARASSQSSKDRVGNEVEGSSRGCRNRKPVAEPSPAEARRLP